MSDPAPSPELLRSLSRLVRGLSALFWALPAALIFCLGTASAGWFGAFGHFGFIPSLVSTGLLFFGLWQLGSFQKQERPWRSVLDRARLFALLNFGLSPFPFWWNSRPDNQFFAASVIALAFSAMLFVFELNFVLQRLGAMLPDEGLRLETRQYTRVNRQLLIALVTLSASYLIFLPTIDAWLGKMTGVPGHVDILSVQITIPSLGWQFGSFWLVWLMVCLLVLLPLSMTMALIWKTKEVIMDGVFGVK